MLTSDESFQKYTSILGSYLPLSGPGPLDPAANLADLGLDSLNTIEILVRLEEEFDIQIPDEKLVAETFATVGSLWSVLSSLTGAPAV
jgi:acyl carrier protein